jgi:antitoxin component of RelBE/YafQ-DinJ toxin-antitoxin module
MSVIELRPCLEPELLQQAQAVLQAEGLDVATAVGWFLRGVAKNGALREELADPKAVTLAAIREAKKGYTTCLTLEFL